MLPHECVLVLLWMDIARGHFLFFFNDTATTEIYTLSLHDALPICPCSRPLIHLDVCCSSVYFHTGLTRSEEHTSELQSPDHLVCRLLLEKKKKRFLSRPKRTADIADSITPGSYIKDSFAISGTVVA